MRYHEASAIEKGLARLRQQCRDEGKDELARALWDLSTAIRQSEEEWTADIDHYGKLPGNLQHCLHNVLVQAKPEPPPVELAQFFDLFGAPD